MMSRLVSTRVSSAISRPSFVDGNVQHLKVISFIREEQFVDNASRAVFIRWFSAFQLRRGDMSLRPLSELEVSF